MFGQSVISQNLLTEQEINQLIFAAPVKKADYSSALFQRGRVGEQITSARGAGSDFAEVRAYLPGDEPRHIDWRATARTGKPLIRTYHNEMSQSLCLLIDRRTAMRYATRTRLKVTQALRLALWLGGREARSGREISAVLLDEPSHWLPPQQGMASLKLMAKLANSPCPPCEMETPHDSNWKRIIAGLEQHVARGSELILLSDFYGLGKEDNKILHLLGNHCRTTAVQITDPFETREGLEKALLSASMQLQWGQKTQQLPAKSSKQIFLLQQALQQRTERISRQFRQANINYLQLSVEQNELSSFGTGDLE